jgi:hypothetical protein
MRKGALLWLLCLGALLWLSSAGIGTHPIYRMVLGVVILASCARLAEPAKPN